AIYSALGKHYNSLTGVQVPKRPGIAESARDAFMQLLSFGTLAAWTIALGAIFFEFINWQFPDVVTSGRFTENRYSLASNLASLLVSFPVYLYLMRFILREYVKYPDKRESAVRKWLTWLAMLIASGVIIGDLTTFLSYFLRGELSVRFALKVIVVLIISGGVFSYYLTSLRGSAEEPQID
ncbi:MAG: hypothetical protein H7Y20_15360, partial [Bryobacteraceae bacterium]|nr:hypothetical protein [Bryobacteraceae bacterium]